MKDKKTNIIINKSKKVFLSCIVSISIWGSMLPINAENANSQNHPSPAFNNQSLPETRSARQSAEPIDLSQLFTTDGGDKLIILFEGKKFKIRLKRGTENFSNLSHINLDPSQEKKKTLDGQSNEYGWFFNIGLTSQDANSFTLSSDNTTVYDSSGKQLVGRYSGNFIFHFQDGREVNTGKLSLMFLKVENDNKTIFYIDERPSVDQILSRVQIKYGEIIELPDENSAEWKQLRPWKQKNLKAKREEQIKDAEELKQLFNKIDDSNNKYVYKKITAFSEDGVRHEGDQINVEGNKKYTLHIEITNPTHALDENNNVQAVPLDVELVLKDTKTPFKEELNNYTTDGLNKINDKIDKLALTQQDKTALGITDDMFSNLKTDINEKKTGAISAIESVDLKHRDIDIDPFEGDDSAQAQAKQNAQAKRDEIQKPIKASLSKSNAKIDAIIIAKNRMDDINKNSTLTELEKQKLIKDIKDKLKTQLDNIDKLSVDDLLNEPKINELKENFKRDLTNNVKIDDDRKQKTITTNKLNTKALEKIDAISKDNTLTQSEKDVLINQVNQKLEEAKQAVSSTSKDDDVIAQETKFDTTLSAISHKGVKNKDAAKEQIDNYVSEQTNTINNNKNLTREEKDATIKAIGDAATKAKKVIEDSVIDDVKQPLATPQLSNLVQTGKDEIDQAITANIATIKPDALSEINEKKEGLNNKVEGLVTSKKISEKDKAYYQDKINAVNSDIQYITDNHLDNNTVNTKKALAIAKLDVVDKIIEALVEKTKTINQTNELTEKEKEDAIAAIRKIADTKLTEIQSATDISQVNVDQTVQEIGSYTLNPSAKQTAINAINAEKEKKLAEINDKFTNGIISEDEKNSYTDKVNQAASLAINAINQDANISEKNLAKFKDEAISSITAVKPLGLDKIKAKLDEIADKKKQDIQGDNKLIGPEKNDLIDEVTNKLEEITKDLNIDEIIKKNPNLSTEQLQNIIERKQTELIESLKDVRHQGQTAKEKAIDDLRKHKDAKLIELDEALQAGTISQSEKQERENTLNQSLEAAIYEIENKKDLNQNGLDALKELAIKKMDTIDELISEKHKMFKEIDAKEKDLTIEEQLQRKKQLSGEIAQTIENVGDATKSEQIEPLVTTGKQALTDIVNNQNTFKRQVESEINTARDEKIKEITNNQDLSDKEKEEYIEALTAKVKSVIDAINDQENAHKNSIDAQKDDLLKEIETFETPAKDKARKVLDDALKAKIKEITESADKKFTSDERQAQIETIKKLAEEALEAINNKNTDQDELDEIVKEFTDPEKGKISAFTEVPVQKPAAISALTEAKDQKLQEIYHNPTLVDEEKEELKQLVLTEFEKAKKAINDADSNDSVQQLTKQGIDTIDQLEYPKTEKKAQAIEELKNLKDTLVSEITNNSLYTNEEKEKQISKLDKEFVRVERLINTNLINTTNLLDALVQETKNNFNKAKIEESDTLKYQAKSELEANKDAKIKEIEKDISLTTDEQKTLIDKVKEEYEKAKAEINKAQSNELVNKAKEKGLENIKSIAHKGDKNKHLAIEAIKARKDAKITLINNDNTLTIEERNVLIKQVNNIFDKAKSYINDNQFSNQELENEKNTAIKNIEAVKHQGPKQKEVNKQKLQEMFKAKLASINSDSTLTIEEKTTLINKINQLEISVIKDLETLNTNTSINKLISDTSTKLSLIIIEEKDKVKEIAKAKIIAQAKLLEESIYANQDITSKQTYELLAILHKNKLEALKAIDEALDNETVNSVRLKPVYISSVKNTQNKSTNMILPNTGYKKTFTYYLPLLLVSVAGLIKKHKKR